MSKRRLIWFQHPSWWLVVVAGALFVTFSVAIVREFINSHQVQQQVSRLQGEVATEQKRQQQLQELIDYLGSPTFQEQEARLKLGLKKDGEQVMVVPTTKADQLNTNGQTTTAGGQTIISTPASHPQQWWQYFFGSHSTLNP